MAIKYKLLILIVWLQYAITTPNIRPITSKLYITCTPWKERTRFVLPYPFSKINWSEKCQELN